jgi:hypothetical protein
LCIDFRDLNKATLMDGYLMPVADALVNVAAGHKAISFMDGNTDTTKYSWLWKILRKLLSSALVMLAYTSGLS